VDNNGIPFSLLLKSGNINDSIMLEDAFSLIKVPLDKSKIHVLADAGYDSLNNKKFLKSQSYNVVIALNKRGTKDINKLEKNKLSVENKNHLKNRVIVENFFAWKEIILPRGNRIIERKMENYLSSIYLCAIHLIFKKNPTLN